jgi:hypothetical protein
VNYFKGQFFRCEFDGTTDKSAHTIDDRQDCLDLGGFWVNHDSNFDNSGQAILTLFIMSTTEGWLEVMHHGVDANGIHM